MRLKAAKYTPPRPPQGDGRAALEISAPRALIDSNNNSNSKRLMAKRALHLPPNRVNENKPLQSSPQWCGAGLSLTLKSSKKCLEDCAEGGFGQEPSAAAKAKVAELTIIELVEQSAVAAEDGNVTLALVKARKALEALNALKVRLAQERRKQESASTKVRGPVTKGVGLYELGLMVNSNLAHQLRNDRQRREAIEIYTQLCRMASSSGSPVAASTTSQQLESQTLLYSFGLNIGNLHHELGDYQRALKYYRLTLDRLSSTGWANLRIKLMNNISLTLVAMQQINDAASSLNLLLEDNLKSGPASSSQVNNSNHHKFGLNLIVCHHQRCDPSAMLATFKQLVGINICHHYERVARSFDNEQIVLGSSEGGQVKNNGRMLQQVATGNNRDEQQPVAAAASGQSASEGRKHPDPTAEIRTAGSGSEWAPVTGRANFESQTKANELSDRDSLRQESMNNDRLEMLIGERQNQISRSLIMGCNLIFDLDSRGLITNSNMPAKTNETSVLDLCIKVLQASDTYRGLVCDLKANSIEVMLENGYKLDDAIDVLREIELEQQVEVDQKRDNDAAIVKSLTGKNHSQPTPTGAAMNGNLNRKSGGHQWSSVAATNACLLNQLQGNTIRAIEFGHKALQVNNSNVKTLVNLANCYIQLDDLVQAESLWRRALELRSTGWETNHNLALLARRLNRHHDQLDLATRQSLDRDWDCSPGLFRRNMILSMTQLALIQRQSGNTQQASAIVSTMINSSKQAPEIHLLANDLVLNDKNPGAKSLAINALQQANKDFPYHLPLAERLIALHIQNFNYDATNKLIGSCIKNRPDQVKWFQMLAECYRRATNYNKSISIYKHAIESFPQDTTCLRSLIKLFDELGLTEESKLYVTKLNKVLKMLLDRMIFFQSFRQLTSIKQHSCNH